jgi:GTPase SAR1 family protein
LFFKDKAIYVLMVKHCDVKSVEEAQYLLQMVNDYASNSPIILVCSHSNDPETAEYVSYVDKLKELIEHNPRILVCHKIDSKDDTNGEESLGCGIFNSFNQLDSTISILAKDKSLVQSVQEAALSEVSHHASVLI